MMMMMMMMTDVSLQSRGSDEVKQKRTKPPTPSTNFLSLCESDVFTACLIHELNKL